MSTTNAIAGYGPTTRRERRPTGQLYRTKTRSPSGTSFAVRFRWNGERMYRTLGHSQDGWTKASAEKEIERLMSALWIGAWDPAEDDREAEQEAAEEETFDSFSLGWYERRRASGGRNGDGLSESGEADLAQCRDHLLTGFGGMKLSEITTEKVERFAHAKRTSPRGGKGPHAGRALSGTYVRKMVRVLSAILRDAVRYERIPRNVAEDVRVKAPKFNGTSLDSADAISALLDAAGEIDAKRKDRRGHGRPLLAVLVFAGLRIDEALSLLWRDVDLAAGYLRVRRSKTEAGVREVDLLPPLREELADLKARRDPEPATRVFATRTGGKESPSNVRNRLLRPAAERVNAAREAEGKEPLPHLTPHSLRRTYCSLLVALGVDPGHVMDQMGHADEKMTMSVYRKAVKRRDGERERLRALVEGSELPGVPADAELAEEPA